MRELQSMQEFGDIDLNFLLETIAEQWCTASSMAVFTRFWENIM